MLLMLLIFFVADVSMVFVVVIVDVVGGAFFREKTKKLAHPIFHLRKTHLCSDHVVDVFSPRESNGHGIGRRTSSRQ